MIVDQSGSMNDEIASVRANVNKLSDFLKKSGVDYRFVMIASVNTGSNAICVPQPLAGHGCGENPNVSLPVDQQVLSTDALQIVLNTRPLYESFLREDALKVFIPVTDDNSADINAGSFDAQLIGPTSPFGTDAHRKYVFYP